MFCLQAPDLLPLGDMVNTIKELLDIHDKEGKIHAKQWSPYRLCDLSFGTI
jgi:3-methyladenine DNA glycosylase/8-oxoguanine DNA glycosylase